MEESIIKRSERAFDDFLELFRRRKIACLVVLLILILPAIGFAIANFYGKDSLKNKVNDLKTERDSLRADRDAKAAQLAPFLAIANQRFQSAPPDKRLDLLVSRVEELARAVEQTAALLPQPAKMLDSAELVRLQKKLDFIETRTVQVSSINGDKRASELAGQLASLFQNSGFSIKAINSVLSAEPIEGIKVRLREEPDEALGSVFKELFKVLDAKSTISIDSTMTVDIDILVGTR